MQCGFGVGGICGFVAKVASGVICGFCFLLLGVILCSGYYCSASFRLVFVRLLFGCLIGLWCFCESVYFDNVVCCVRCKL